MKNFFKKFLYNNKHKVKFKEIENLSETIIKFVSPRIKAFAEEYKNSDEDFFPSPCKTINEWYEILDKIVWAFAELNGEHEQKNPVLSNLIEETKYSEKYNNLNYLEVYLNNLKKQKKHPIDVNILLEKKKKIEEGLELFHKYFRYFVFI